MKKKLLISLCCTLTLSTFLPSLTADAATKVVTQKKICAPAVRGILTYDYNTVNSYVSNGRNAIVEKIPGYYTGIYVNYTKKIIKARSIEYHLDTTGRFTDLDMSTQVNHVFKGYMGSTSNV